MYRCHADRGRNQELNFLHIWLVGLGLNFSVFTQVVCC